MGFTPVVNSKSDLKKKSNLQINPLSPELNPICYLLALLAHDFLHVSRIRVKQL
jgi:transposase